MSELTKEYFEAYLDGKISGLVTKEVFNDAVSGLVTRHEFNSKINNLVTKKEFNAKIENLVTKDEFNTKIDTLATKNELNDLQLDLDERFDEMGRMINQGFEDITDRKLPPWKPSWAK